MANKTLHGLSVPDSPGRCYSLLSQPQPSLAFSPFLELAMLSLLLRLQSICPSACNARTPPQLNHSFRSQIGHSYFQNPSWGWAAYNSTVRLLSELRQTSVPSTRCLAYWGKEPGTFLLTVEFQYQAQCLARRRYSDICWAMNNGFGFYWGKMYCLTVWLHRR